MNKQKIKIITLGHSQHGKSSIAGLVFINLLKSFLPEEKYKKIIKNLEFKLEKCCRDYDYQNNLYYALIFDGIKKDIIQEKGVFKTFTTKPFTLKVESQNELIELTDLPGHQSFLRRATGSIEVSDIGLFAVDSNAFMDAIKEDPELDVLEKQIVLKGDPKGAIEKGIAPLGYKEMVEAKKEEVKRIKRLADSTSKDEKRRSLLDKMKPPIIAGIFNYISIACYLGIKNIIFAVHKMDILKYNEEDFFLIKDFLGMLIEKAKQYISLDNITFDFVPTSIVFNESFGDSHDVNIINTSTEQMQWYKDQTLYTKLLERISENIKIANSHNGTEPFIFQVDNFKYRSSGKEAYFKPTIHGYVHRGEINNQDRIIMAIRGNKTSFTDPMRISLQKEHKAENKIINKISYGTYGQIFLNSTDVKKIEDKKLQKNVFYYGNLCFKENEKKQVPILMSDKIDISFVFIGGWLYKEDFFASLIYGYNKIDAKFLIKNQNKYFDENIIANVELNEAIPFFNLSPYLSFQKVILEKYTYIVGLGRILAIH